MTTTSSSSDTKRSRMDRIAKCVATLRDMVTHGADTFSFHDCATALYDSIHLGDLEYVAEHHELFTLEMEFIRQLEHHTHVDKCLDRMNRLVLMRLDKIVPHVQTDRGAAFNLATHALPALIREGGHAPPLRFSKHIDELIRVCTLSSSSKEEPPTAERGRRTINTLGLARFAVYIHEAQQRAIIECALQRANTEFEDENRVLPRRPVLMYDRIILSVSQLLIECLLSTDLGSDTSVTQPMSVFLATHRPRLVSDPSSNQSRNADPFEEYDQPRDAEVPVLGEGAAGRVFAVIHKGSLEIRALKQQTYFDLDSVIHERNMLMIMPPHPNLMRAHRSFMYNDAMYFDMPMGEDMYKVIRTHAVAMHDRKAQMNEKVQTIFSMIATVMRAVIPAIQHLKKHDVAHCDIKLTNMCLVRGGVIQLMDFGACARISDPRPSNPMQALIDHSYEFKMYKTSFAPEMYVDMKWTDPRITLHHSDIWATANLAHEIKLLIIPTHDPVMMYTETEFKMLVEVVRTNAPTEAPNPPASADELTRAMGAMSVLYDRDAEPMLRWANAAPAFVFGPSGTATAQQRGAPAFAVSVPGSTTLVTKPSMPKTTKYTTWAQIRNTKGTIQFEYKNGLDMESSDIRTTEYWDESSSNIHL